MKDHISITVDREVVHRVKRYAFQEKRSVSQILEMALEDYLDVHSKKQKDLVTSSGAFRGQFSREETYAGR